MSRTSTVPTRFSTLGELERGYLHLVRRFRRGLHEIAAGPIVLSGGSGGRETAPRAQRDDPQHAELELLKSQAVLLQNMGAQVITTFPGDARAEPLRRQIEALQRSVEERGEQLRRDLGRKARGTVERTVVVRNHMLMRQLESSLGKSLGQVTEMYLTGPCRLPGMRGEDVTCDVAYLSCRDLRGPDGFVHPRYVVATAYPRDPGNGRLQPMYVGASATFLTPARLSFAATARTPQELAHVVSDILVGEGVIGAGFQRDLPVQEGDVRFAHENVRKTTVADGQVRVLVKDKKRIAETRDALRRELTGIVRQVDPRNRDVIRDRVDPARGVISFVFSLPGNLRGRLVDSHVLRRLQQVLDLDPATLQRVRTAIENPE